jgi:PE family
MFVTTIPGVMEATAGEIGVIGAVMGAANAGAAVPLSGVLPPGWDEVSALMALQFQTHGAMHEAMQGMGSVIHAAHAATLAASGVSYDGTEVAIATTMT